MFEHPRAEVETKKRKSKDQVEESLVMSLNKLEKISKDMKYRDRLHLNKLTTLQKAQKSSSTQNNNPFTKKPKDEGIQGLSEFPTLWL